MRGATGRPPVVEFTLRVLRSMETAAIVQETARSMVELFDVAAARVVDRDGEEHCAHGAPIEGFATAEGGGICSAEGDPLVQWRFSLGAQSRLLLELWLVEDPDLAIMRHQFMDLIAVVRRTVKHSMELADERDEAMRDPLTGVENRRSMTRVLETRFAEVQLHGGQLTVMVVDLDRFKEINDTEGHAAGDEVLRTAAETLRRSVRGTDRVGRWGGDEFVVVLEHLDAQTAKLIADRVREAFAADPGSRGATMSIGLADLTALPPGGGADALVATADASLYKSKRSGRNRTSVAA